MGFHINGSYKIRVTLSEKADTIIKDDLNMFSTFNETKFFNQIIENFGADSKASFTSYCSRQVEEFKESIKDCKIPNEAKKKIFQTLERKIKTQTKEELRSYMDSKYSNTTSKLFRINNKNVSYLQYYSDIEYEADIYGAKINSDDEHNKEYSGVSKYVRCILEEYATLSLIQRVHIIKKKEYDIVNAAILQNKPLQITKKKNSQEFMFYPYKIISDNWGFQEYLTGYSKKKNGPNDEKIASSFSMIRLEENEIKTRAKTRKKLFSEKEIKELEKNILERSPSFLLGEKEKIHVRLTEAGKKLYRTKLNYRPQKDSDSTENEYIFSCTEQQAYVYFFAFGADAEIISPISLRERMKAAYKNAYEHYE
ncbi:WYL domain-containing protein [Blautia stercoris]|uniref:WYL domain-containing protein n=1 Tax=Blautia stercoris TaxID=871664 RepID=UPI00355B074C